MLEITEKFHIIVKHRNNMPYLILNHICFLDYYSCNTCCIKLIFPHPKLFTQIYAPFVALCFHFHFSVHTAVRFVRVVTTFVPAVAPSSHVDTAAIVASEFVSRASRESYNIGGKMYRFVNISIYVSICFIYFIFYFIVIFICTTDR